MAGSTTPKKRVAKKAGPTQPKPQNRNRPAASAISTAEDWLAEADGAPVELPSGKVVRMITPGLQAFIAADLIPNDLLPIMMDGMESGAVDDDELKKVAQSPQQVMELIRAMNSIFCYCVTEPKFEELPVKEVEGGMLVYDVSKKEPGILYVDLVTDEDKSFVFNVATGGPRDLATFRELQTAQLGRVAAQ